MGFGGATAAANVSLKNNKRGKKRQLTFNGVAHSSKRSSKIPLKPITTKALNEIKVRTLKENEALHKKHLIIFSCIMLPLLIAVVTSIFY